MITGLRSEVWQMQSARRVRRGEGGARERVIWAAVGSKVILLTKARCPKRRGTAGYKASWIKRSDNSGKEQLTRANTCEAISATEEEGRGRAGGGERRKVKRFKLFKSLSDSCAQWSPAVALQR